MKKRKRTQKPRRTGQIDTANRDEAAAKHVAALKNLTNMQLAVLRELERLFPKLGSKDK